MITFDAFVEELQVALVRLYDPGFRPSSAFVEVLFGDGVADSQAWAQGLLAAIARMEPSPVVPAAARARRLFQVLNLRYVQRLTQEETAERLHITSRHVRREQNDAVTGLGQILWQRRTPGLDSGEQAIFVTASAQADDDWSAQLHQELTALQRHVPEGTADVGEVLSRIVDLLTPVFASSGVTLRLNTPDRNAMAAAHPSGLRQLLVRCLTEWVRHLEGGEIEGSVRSTTAEVLILLTGSRASIDHLRQDGLVQALLQAYNSEIGFGLDAGRTTLTITLPAAPPVRVLVVDDNEDLLHFYRRYLQDTRFQITALTGGAALIETMESLHPDVIILDVMLPITDGWELLTELRQHWLGRTIPVIVCSVIQEEELALALGASAYLSKPVRRSSLINALNAVLLGAVPDTATPQPPEPPPDAAAPE